MPSVNCILQQFNSKYIDTHLDREAPLEGEFLFISNRFFVGSRGSGCKQMVMDGVWQRAGLTFTISKWLLNPYRQPIAYWQSRFMKINSFYRAKWFEVAAFWWSKTVAMIEELSKPRQRGMVVEKLLNFNLESSFCPNSSRRRELLFLIEDYKHLSRRPPL